MTILLEPHLLHLKAEGKAPSTIEARDYWLRAAEHARDGQGRPYFRYGIDEASTDEWRAFLADQDWSAWTRATTYNHYAGFYRWATSGDDPPLDWNPFTSIRRPPGGHSIPDPVDTGELQIALDQSDEWWRFVILLAAQEGLRAGELATLAREDVTADRIRVRHGKGDRPREIPTHPDVWELVAPRPPGLLIRSQVRHVPVPRHRLTVLARQHFDRIGLPDVHLHRFRHRFATALIRRGVDLSIVSKLMGHASVATTMVYVLITGGQRRDAIETLPTLNGHPSGLPSGGQVDRSGPERRARRSVTALPKSARDRQLVGDG